MSMPEKIYVAGGNVYKPNDVFSSNYDGVLLAKDAFECKKYHRDDIVKALEAQNKMMAEALKRIAEYTHECGCVPCRDQCRSKEALQVTLDCLIDAAREALAQQIGENNVG